MIHKMHLMPQMMLVLIALTVINITVIIFEPGSIKEVVVGTLVIYLAIVNAVEKLETKRVETGDKDEG